MEHHPCLHPLASACSRNRFRHFHHFLSRCYRAVINDSGNSSAAAPSAVRHWRPLCSDASSCCCALLLMHPFLFCCPGRFKQGIVGVDQGLVWTLVLFLYMVYKNRARLAHRPWGIVPSGEAYARPSRPLLVPARRHPLRPDNLFAGPEVCQSAAARASTGCVAEKRGPARWGSGMHGRAHLGLHTLLVQHLRMVRVLERLLIQALEHPKVRVWPRPVAGRRELRVWDRRVVVLPRPEPVDRRIADALRWSGGPQQLASIRGSLSVPNPAL